MAAGTIVSELELAHWPPGARAPRKMRATTLLFVPRPEVEFAAKLVERYAATRIPPDMQDEIRLEVETVANSITIWECRPPWRPEYGREWTRMGIA